MFHNTAVTKQWTTKWPLIANTVFRIYKIITNKVTFDGYRGGMIAPPAALRAQCQPPARGVQSSDKKV